MAILGISEVGMTTGDDLVVGGLRQTDLG